MECAVNKILLSCDPIGNTAVLKLRLKKRGVTISKNFRLEKSAIGYEDYSVMRSPVISESYTKESLKSFEQLIGGE